MMNVKFYPKTLSSALPLQLELLCYNFMFILIAIVAVCDFTRPPNCLLMRGFYAFLLCCSLSRLLILGKKCQFIFEDCRCLL